MPKTALHYSSIAELAHLIRSGELSPVEITKIFLDRIGSFDDTLHAFIQITPERALGEAAAAEAALRSGCDLGPLHGIPYAAKDLFDIKGYPTTAGTHLRDNHIAKADCSVVSKLSEAGMVLLGKTHTSQLAMTPAGVNHDAGTPFNPWHHEQHVPGGSSSGSAVAVASGLAPVAIGTDTCSSVRGPAALCGVVGLKPTVGRISRSGVYPLSSTMDSPGPLARAVEDAAYLYQAMQGFDEKDASTASAPEMRSLENLRAGIDGYRLCFGETVFFDDADNEVAAAVRAAGLVFESLGATVDGIELPEIAMTQEMPNRFDFVLGEGYRFNKDLLEEHEDALDPLVLGLKGGKAITAAALEELRQTQEALRGQLCERLRDVDAIIVPTTHEPAHPLALVDANEDRHWEYADAYLRNTFLGTFLGLCSISVPCGFTEGGLPIGLLVYAKPFEEDVALRVAFAYEQATEWHHRHPNLSWAG